MGKRYSNVKEIMEEYKVSKNVKDDVEREIEGKKLSWYLCSLRCKKGLTQQEMAKKLQCSQSKISKIESSFDDCLTIGEVQAYANACSLELEIGFRDPSRQVRIVDLIKHHAFRIQHYLDHLREMAKDDESLIDAICDFHNEVDHNLGKIVRKSKSLLTKAIPKRRAKREQEIRISPPLSERKKDKKTEESCR